MDTHKIEDAFEPSIARVVQVLDAFSVSLLGAVKSIQNVFQVIEQGTPAYQIKLAILKETDPVAWVQLVGPDESGFTIHPDEEWRYRANLDWWNNS
jgi:hypothetical protein